MQLTKKQFKSEYSMWRRAINGNDGRKARWSAEAFDLMCENAHPAVRMAFTYAAATVHIPTSQWGDREFEPHVYALVNMQLPASFRPGVN